MESFEEAPICKDTNNCEKIKSEPSSDRESSVESFHTNASEISTTTEAELIDVDDIELSDEESWLYKSPKRFSVTNKTIATFKHFDREPKGTDDAELQLTKNALNKLDHLKGIDGSTKAASDQSLFDLDSKLINKIAKIGGEHVEERLDKVKNKENELLDASDVQKIASLQEESLRQTSSRFLVQAERKFQNEKCSPTHNLELNKPASVEALNICSGKYEDASMIGLIPVQRLAKQNQYGSHSSLNGKSDIHRSSLPDINPGYYTVRPKKSKRLIDAETPFPLPIYPQHKAPLSRCEVSPVESQRRYTEVGNCSTLPPSYRLNSQSSSSSRKDVATPRRDSNPLLLGVRNGSIPNLTRRDSAPCNPPKFLSPLSSPTLHQRRNQSSQVFHVKSPTLSSSKPPRNSKSQRIREPHRTPSPSRRLPLTTMHNQSPKRAYSPAPCRRETLMSSTKIPSPALRSGIPVPSYISRGNDDDDTWSQDCF